MSRTSNLTSSVLGRFILTREQSARHLLKHTHHFRQIQVSLFLSFFFEKGQRVNAGCYTTL